MPFSHMLPAGLGLTPPMGWSSWNVFAAGIDEDKIMTSIDAMAELVSAGYQYVNVDDNWIYSAHGSRTCCGNAASGGDDPHWQQ
jgi:hypothetical protein